MLDEVESIRKGSSNGKVWLVEHESVYTAGRATPTEQQSSTTVPIERGGQITYHGPGQLVVYPVMPLPERDIRRWLRRLEAFGVAICAAFDLDATPSVDGTGVFVGQQKVGSIGVAIRHWISFHGISINVAMDLSAFDAIRPCGLHPSIMTDLQTILRRPIALDEAKNAAVGALEHLVG